MDGSLTNAAVVCPECAACDSPGAHASGAALTRATCLMQLQHCARVRKLCAPHVTALLLHLPAADATMMLPVPTHEALEKVVDSLFGRPGWG